MLHHQIPETLRCDQFHGQPAEKQTCGSHNSRGFVVGGSSIKNFFGSDTHVWRKTTEPSSPRSYILLDDVLCEAAYDIKTLKLGTALKEQVFILSY